MSYLRFYHQWRLSGIVITDLHHYQGGAFLEEIGIDIDWPRILSNGVMTVEYYTWSSYFKQSSTIFPGIPKVMKGRMVKDDDATQHD